MREFFKKIYWNIYSTHQWNILFKSINSDDWIRLNQPKNISRADPFIINENNRNYIFFEEFDISKRHGYLCVGELNQDTKSIDNVEVCLEKSYHLSFPNVFKYKDNYFMIPESHENKSIDLYKFDNFPYKLKKVKTLVNDIDAVDSVIIFKDRLCYLFTNILLNKNCYHSENLSIFTSTDLFKGTFIENHTNPVESDPSYSRMAGQFFQENDKLFRVSQDCKNMYGYKINIFQVNELSENYYKESLAKELFPPKGYIAFHTFNRSENIMVADGKTIVKTPKVLMGNIFDLFNLLLKKIRT